MKKMFYVLLILGSLFTGAASAGDVIEAIEKGGAVLGTAGVLLLGIISFVGVVIGFMGLMRMRSQQNGQTQGGGFKMLALGLAIAVLPWIYAAFSQEFTGEEVDVTAIKEDVYD